MDVSPASAKSGPLASLLGGGGGAAPASRPPAFMLEGDAFDRYAIERVRFFRSERAWPGPDDRGPDPASAEPHRR